MQGRLKFDWHTHTVYSHGKGTIEDNVKRAVELGLESIAITDHGPGHFGYGFKRKDIPNMRRDIDELSEKYPDIKIYMSVEANIINPSGELDVYPEEFELYDFVIAGYHFGTLGEDKPSSLILHSRNLLASKLGTSSEALVDFNTRLTVKALKTNRIKTLTHPGDKAEVNMAEIYRACEETGTYLEISNRHKQLTVEQIKEATAYNVKFIIGSDAHISENVGSCEKALQRIEQAGLDPARVVNLEIQE